jgi:hypothetical protein
MKLSVVIAGRNDNYGGDFRNRLQQCVRWTHNRLTEARIPSEIIFVNYNPLPNDPIEHFIEWPATNEFVLTRIITIPGQLHKEVLQKNDIKNVPVLEYVAKNAGIRRSKGDFILCMNPDITIPDIVVKEFAALDSGKYYRTNRYDYLAPEKTMVSNEKAMLQHIITHVTRIWLKGVSYAHPNSKVSTWALLTYKLRAEIERDLYSFLRLFNFVWRKKLHAKAEYRYHCNVSGDFMLMHRNNWLKLRGHHEGTYLALHVDALMVVQAAAAGLAEKVFSAPVYHMEHERRYDANMENADFRKAYVFFQEQAQLMINSKKSFIYNSEDWGLAPYSLQEVKL